VTSPPRGYSWPPFEPGNVAAVRHGACSSPKVAEVAETLRPTLAGPLEACPWIEDHDGAEVDASAADCTDGVGRDRREFGLRPGSLRAALLDSSRRDTAERS